MLDEGSAAIESAGFMLDYLEARHADSLTKVASIADGPLRLLVAARLGSTRLIDNVAVPNAPRKPSAPRKPQRRASR